MINGLAGSSLSPLQVKSSLEQNVLMRILQMHGKALITLVLLLLPGIPTTRGQLPLAKKRQITTLCTLRLCYEERAGHSSPTLMLAPERMPLPYTGMKQEVTIAT